MVMERPKGGIGLPLNSELTQGAPAYPEPVVAELMLPKLEHWGCINGEVNNGYGK